MKPHRLIVLFAGACALARAQVTPTATAADPALPPVQFFVPGFVARELPVQLTNQNNVAYAPDGRLFTAGYDGRVHLLRDTDGDGLEDTVTTLWDKTSGDYALGLLFHDGALYVMFRNEVARFRDTDGDGIPETREVALTGWDDPALASNKLLLRRRVDAALGLAIGPDGSFYLSMGNAAYNKPYLLDAEGRSTYDPRTRRGCVLRISPDGKTVEQLASGVRYLMSLQFNRYGDLFATDQEGATWLPNGNPFDELLHLETGRHYGFPPRHPRHLPDVIDEPSVFDFGPQHQSVCGFRFNDPAPGRGRFGPAWWEGDALLTAMSRGKLYRTQLVKTPAGYVAQTQLIAGLQALALDCALSPRGDLLVTAHTGKPDWGTGPQGIGRLFKLSAAAGEVPRSIFAYAASATETRVEFDRPLNPAQWRNLARLATLESGRTVTAGDRYEKLRPGYAVVTRQLAEPPTAHPVLGAALSADARTIVLRTAPNVTALPRAVALPDPTRAATQAAAKDALPQDAFTSLAYDLGGVEAEWQPAAAGAATATAWLPHADLRVARAFTAPSAAHEKFFAALRAPGTLRLRGQLDLAAMLRPAVQEGALLDFAYPPETVSVVFSASAPLRVSSAAAKIEQLDARTARLTVAAPAAWVPLEIALATGEGSEPALDVHWFTAEDARPRALPLRRVIWPWAQPPGAAPAPAAIPEIAGGDWEAGRKLYFGAAACATCHAIRGQGGALGPDLSNVIHRDYASVLKDIVDPNATINPDHLGYTIELTDGTALAGVLAGETPDAIQLTDAASITTAIPRSRIRVVRPLPMSLMPPGLLDALQPAERRDLMTFLLRRRE